MNKLRFDSYIHDMDNGLKVVSIKRDTKIASLHAGIKVGAMDEKKKERGISHLIEHMLFKGTKTRDNERLNEELEFLGGEYNAYTDYNCTVYSITALEEELKNSIELLSDMLINSVFDEKELEKERNVIIAEIRSNKDDVEDYSFKKVNEYAFEKSPLKNDVAGTERTVNSLSKEMVQDYYNKFYVANNCVLTVVSSYAHEEVIAMVEHYFKAWKKADIKRKRKVIEENRDGIMESFKKDIEQSTVTFLFTFHNLPKDFELPLKMLNLKLGESSNSILFRELRENKGLAYDVYTFLDMSKNVKSLYIYTAVSEDNVAEAIETIESCIERIKDRSIIFNDTTVELMKKVHKTAVISTLEDATDLGNYVLHQCLDEEAIYEFLEDMDALTKLEASHIYEVANIVLNKPTVHILKPK